MWLRGVEISRISMELKIKLMKSKRSKAKILKMNSKATIIRFKRLLADFRISHSVTLKVIVIIQIS